MRQPLPTDPNPVLDFGIDKADLRYIGNDLQRPECILAEPDGMLWVADARGGVMRIAPDGSQNLITQRSSALFETAGNEAARYLKARCRTAWRSRATASSSSRISARTASK